MKRFTMIVLFALMLLLTAASAWAQESTAPTTPHTGAWALFKDSFDAFTVLLLGGSVAGIAMIFIALFEVRESEFLPKGLSGRCVDLARTGRIEA